MYTCYDVHLSNHCAENLDKSQKYFKMHYTNVKCFRSNTFTRVTMYLVLLKKNTCHYKNWSFVIYYSR